MAEGFLTTHILDTANGIPAHGVRIQLYRLEAGTGQRTLLTECITNDDGRTDTPILGKEDFAIGQYELIFQIGDYFRQKGLKAEEPLFLDEIPLRFGINDVQSHYHVPLLASPYSFSTYRGS